MRRMLSPTVRGKGSLVECHFCVYETNLIIWILVDGLLPATDNHAHAIPRRSTELIRAKRAGDGSDAEPEPEAEPEDDYYCVKKSLGGNTLKSCLPKVSLDGRPPATLLL